MKIKLSFEISEEDLTKLVKEPPEERYTKLPLEARNLIDKALKNTLNNYFGTEKEKLPVEKVVIKTTKTKVFKRLSDIDKLRVLMIIVNDSDKIKYMWSSSTHLGGF